LKKFYKLIVSKFFKIVYGNIKSVHNKSESFLLKSIIKKNKKYIIYRIPSCRVFTNTVHDTAYLKENKIIKNISFQIRNNINTNIKKNVVFSIGTPKILRKFDGSVMSLLTGGAGNNNYWHWMYDSISRIGLLDNNFNLNDFNYFLVPDKKYKFQTETLKLLGIEKKSISSKKYKHIFANNLTATNHPWQHSKSAHKDIENVPKWITFWLREKFIKFKSNKKFYKKIYIDRSDSKFSDRKIINEDKIIKLLIKKNFKILKLSDFSFVEQIAIFNSAKIIVGNHGAGFTNLIFCKKKTTVIEFIDTNTAKVIKKISKDLDLNYKSILGRRIGKDKQNQNNNLEVSLFKLNNLIS
tara:strand:+ start:310 stop:1368 length:1059 start_codon:yes stop_codon:yes gene_type:complete